MSCRSGRVERVLLVLAVALVGALVALSLLAGRKERAKAPDPGAREPEAGATRYYLLNGPFEFSPTNFGATPEARSYGGGPWWVPLEECEITPEAAKGHWGWYVTQLHRSGRLEEVGLWYGGVICRRFAFRYDADGRLAGRIDTLYEPRQVHENVGDWVARMKGKTPAVGCVREMAYSWSEDGRTVEVKLVRSEGEEPWAGLPEWPSIGYGQPGSICETWRLDVSGRVADVSVDDESDYSATYDDAGRLLDETKEGTKTTNTYDAQGRLVKTAVHRSINDTMVFVHGYPDAPPSELSPKEMKSDQRFVVIHDKSGHVAEVKMATEVTQVVDFAVTFQRDEQGCVRSMRMGPLGLGSAPIFPLPPPR